MKTRKEMLADSEDAISHLFKTAEVREYASRDYVFILCDPRDDRVSRLLASKISPDTNWDEGEHMPYSGILPRDLFASFMKMYENFDIPASNCISEGEYDIYILGEGGILGATVKQSLLN